jgi:hypothetical protein
MTNQQAELKQLRPMVGGTITKLLEGNDGESFGFQVTKGKTTHTVWVDQDPEGNGPGHLDISKDK